MSQTLMQSFMFAVPILVVAGMALTQKLSDSNVFKGWKTNTQAAILLTQGFLDATDWSFLPVELSGPLYAGSGIAVIIASLLTDRK